MSYNLFLILVLHSNQHICLNDAARIPRNKVEGILISTILWFIEIGELCLRQITNHIFTSRLARQPLPIQRRSGTRPRGGQLLRLGHLVPRRSGVRRLSVLSLWQQGVPHVPAKESAIQRTVGPPVHRLQHQQPDGRVCGRRQGLRSRAESERDQPTLRYSDLERRSCR
jgi:hypothetical protein